MVVLKIIRHLSKDVEEYFNITRQVHDIVRQSGVKNGLVAVITAHTTTGILVNEALPCVEALRSYHQVPGIRNNDLVRMIFDQERELVRDRNVTFVDVFPEFVDEQNEARTEYYRDGLHLNDAGFDRLTELLAPKIHKLLEA